MKRKLPQENTAAEREALLNRTVVDRAKFDQLHGNDPVELKCDYCGTVFSRMKCIINHRSMTQKGFYCTHPCGYNHKSQLAEEQRQIRLGITPTKFTPPTKPAEPKAVKWDDGFFSGTPKPAAPAPKEKTIIKIDATMPTFHLGEQSKGKLITKELEIIWDSDSVLISKRSK